MKGVLTDERNARIWRVTKRGHPRDQSLFHVSPYRDSDGTWCVLSEWSEGAEAFAHYPLDRPADEDDPDESQSCEWLEGLPCRSVPLGRRILTGVK